MRTELSGQEKNIVKVKVEFEAGEFKASLDKTIRDISQKASFPGFRKGHIPRRMLEMRFGKDALYNDAVENMMPDAITQIVDDYDLHIIATPSFNPDTIKEGEPLTGELTFEVIPEVSLPELGDIEVEQLRTVVTDEMVEETLQALRKNLSTLNPVSRPASEGDVVSISVALEDKEPQDDDIDLSDTRLAPGVKESLLGKSPEDELTLDLTPDDLSEEEKQEPAKYIYNVVVKEIKERILPEMTPEFYKQALDVELDSEEAFRDELKKRLYERLERENASKASDAAVQRLVERSELYVPETLLNRQIEHQKKMADANLRQRTGVSMDEFIVKSPDIDAEWERNMRKKAEEVVRRTLVLDEIGEKFGVTVEKEDIEAEIDSRAAMFQIEPDRMRDLYSKNTDSLTQVADDLRYDKIVKAVLERVKVKEVDELTKNTKNSEKPETEGVA